MTEETSKKKKGVLPRTELVILIILLGFFVLWAFKQCSDSIQPIEEMEEVSDADTTSFDTTDLELSENRVDTVQIVQEQTILYVNINNLKLRAEPSLNSEVLEELSLGSKVIYDGAVTDSIYTLNLGTREASEPYVKIRTWKGKTGWVYGAGVDYYQKKVKGLY